VCTPNGDATNNKLLSSFLNEYQSYDVHELVNIDVELVEHCLKKMKTGRAAGVDGIEVEHLLNAHPIAIYILSVLFTAIIQHGYVPASFCKGIIIPIVKDRQGNLSDINNYRGITLGSNISKLFEMCLFESFKSFFVTSDLQMGFKKKLGCSNAIYTIRSLCDYYTQRGSTINMCTLDMSKAFDKVNHFGLYIKLMNKRTPIEFINIMISWYCRCSACVRWDNVFSRTFAIVAGVRQGGVLSPVLFAIYVNDIIVNLEKERLGCYIGDIFLGCIMYADDLVLLSASVVMLQKMIDLCVHEVNGLEMTFNVSKSAVVRIGPAYNNKCVSLKLCNDRLQYVNSVKYLGAVICSAKSFKLSYVEPKESFYKSFNALLYRCKRTVDDIVMVHLVITFCKPLLLYASECHSNCTSYDSRIIRTWNYVFWKIFGINASCINDISEYMGINPISTAIYKRRIEFRMGLSKSENMVMQFLYSLCASREVSSIKLKMTDLAT
jgi:hypothetical protein